MSPLFVGQPTELGDEVVFIMFCHLAVEIFALNAPIAVVSDSCVAPGARLFRHWRYTARASRLQHNTAHTVPGQAASSNDHVITVELNAYGEL